MNSDVLNAVKENSIHVHQVQDKEREKVPRKQPLEKNIEFKVLQKYQGNSSQGSERKQRQLQKVCGSQSQSIICKRNEKLRKMDHTKQKKFVSVTVPSKNHATTFLNSEASSNLSPIKNKVTNDFISDDDTSQDTQFSFPLSIRINSPDKESSCSSQNPSCLLVQTTSDASFEGRFSSRNSEADQNKTQEEPRYFFNFKDKGIYLCLRFR